jgi:NADH:ubiquinone oxidoreductase subunit 6 (subunit J)
VEDAPAHLGAERDLAAPVIVMIMLRYVMVPLLPSVNCVEDSWGWRLHATSAQWAARLPVLVIVMILIVIQMLQPILVLSDNNNNNNNNNNNQKKKKKKMPVHLGAERGLSPLPVRRQSPSTITRIISHTWQ